MNIAGIKSHFTNWREWEFNPIVIKELRQGVRNWAITGMLLLFLCVLFVTTILFLATSGFGEGEAGLGRQILSSFVVILAGASVFFIPLYIGIRVAAERQDNNPDLLYVSTLSPQRIILGKFLCGAYIALLFFSACMPFMAFTNLLRGVDLPTVFVVLVFLFVVVCAANMMAIFLACLPASRPFKFLFVIYFIFQSFGIISLLIAGSFEFMGRGVGTMMASRDFWMGTITYLGIAFALIGLFYVLSVALISPISANRALPVRGYLTAIWILTGLGFLTDRIYDSDPTPILIWAYGTFTLMICSLLVVIGNFDRLSARVRRHIPKTAGKRAVALLFFNGAAGGLLWVALISIATYYLANLFTGDGLFHTRTVPWTGTQREAFSNFYPTTMIYAFDYALTALFIQRRFFPKRPPKLTGLLAVLLVAGWSMIPPIVQFFMNRLSLSSVQRLQLGNIFNVTSSSDPTNHLYHRLFAVGWLAVVLILNRAWFVEQLRNFRPPPAGAPPVIE